jgi:hypothetical protein
MFDSAEMVFPSLNRRQIMKRSTGLISTTAVVLVLTACATIEPSVDRYVAPEVGARWEVVQKGSGSYSGDTRYTITRAENTTWQGKPALSLKGPQTQTLADPVTGRWMAITRLDGTPLMTFEPPMGWDHPVKVGNTYATRQKVTLHALNRTIEFDQSCAVLTYEKLTITLGTFDTFKVRCTTTAGHDETHWVDAKRGLFLKQRLIRTDQYMSGPGIQDNEVVSFTPAKK